MCNAILLCTIFVQLISSCRGLEEIFYSSAHLQQALVEGNNVLKQIDVGQIKSNATKEAVNRFKFDFGFYLSLGKKWTDGIARHPIYIYSMVKDLFKLRKLEKSLPSDVDVKDLPTIDDWKGTALALVRLQYTYDLKTDDMAAGIIAGERSVQLTPEDCYLIGKQAQGENRFDPAIQWFNKALSLKSTHTRALKKKIYSNKCTCEFKAGMRDQALKSVNKWLRLDEDSPEGNKMKAYILKMKDKKITQNVGKLMQNYMTLCRGEQTKESKNVTELSKLKCRFYDNNRHPFLILQPARVEDVNSDPHIKIFRDVLTKTEMRKIQKLTMPELKVSKVLKEQNGTKQLRSEPSKSRISKGYFFNYTRPECVKVTVKLYRRVQAMTGLRAISYQPLQVSNYGIGGFYYSHYDWTVRHIEPHFNERIATLLLYLNKVTAGGATVFPKVGIRMPPSRGDGIFWYNLKRNTLGNDNTLHAGCPVLLGTKWVANVWMGRHHQEFIRPCTLNKDE